MRITCVSTLSSPAFFQKSCKASHSEAAGLGGRPDINPIDSSEAALAIRKANGGKPGYTRPALFSPGAGLATTRAGPRLLDAHGTERGYLRGPPPGRTDAGLFVCC